ncbi:MAG: metallopeptidase TldD-related protein [Zestosphaera sp.]
MDLEKIVKKAVGFGASEADVYLSKATETLLRLSNVIEASKSTKLSSLGIRVVVGKSVAVVGTQDLSEEGIIKALKSAISIARVTPPDPNWISINDKVSPSYASESFDRDTAEATPEDLSLVAGELIEAVKEGCKDAEPVRGEVVARTVEVSYASTYGGPVVRFETLSNLYLYARVNESGRIGTYFDYDIQRSYKKLRARDVGVEVGARARDFIKVGALPDGSYELILASRVVNSVLPIMLGPAVSALNVQRGRSPLIGKLGEALTSGEITIVDLGASSHALGSKPFDDEGHSTSNLAIVEKGVLKTYLYDTYTAAIEGRDSTGNASRTYSSGPVPQPHHLHLQPGKASLEELISEVRKGVLVMNTIGEWLSNPVSGHLNATITHAYVVSNGELVKPVGNGVITANIYELLKDGLEEIGSDVRPSYGVSTPSLKFSRVRIAGS